MLFLMALLLWFALSVPVALILGRAIAAVADRESLSSARRSAMTGHVSVS